MFGYRARIWTDWYRHSWVVGVLLLAYIREQLNAENLKSTYPPGELVALLRTRASHRRRASPISALPTEAGTTSPNPKEGAAGTRFLRNVDLSATHPETGQRCSRRTLAKSASSCSTRPDDADGQPEMAPVAFLNLLAASWIQFMIHDWISHGDVAARRRHHGAAAARTTRRAHRYQQTELVISTTQARPARAERHAGARRDEFHQRSHPLVGRLADLRQRPSHPRPPAQPQSRQDAVGRRRPAAGRPRHDVEEAGFMRNWWVGLSMLHTLFVREHNAICDMLHDAHPDWDDDRLFNVARLINAAVMAKIHSVEWTPAILPNQTLETGLNANWYGLLTYQWRKGKARKTLAEVNIAQPRARRHCRQPDQQARLRVWAVRGIRRGLSAAFAAARNAAAATPRHKRASKRCRLPDDTPARLDAITRRIRDGRPVLLVRQPAPGRVGAQQLSALHAGAQRRGQLVFRHGHGGHPARARARRAAL